ncbi:Retrovirus-related Pol polyprotein from transposon [Zancudomyces culisetae]|uniref:Retrovirus-related Pol polyprotein from transposon n=1 Tax=Zancudomyces culisetae TaxID=1213189 RepID=A0A1R1PNC6_ZANCU|nr:Retrovirus-related Pol polyprotein from transposon [Zancudomyces culisetae]|eukprot:OMH82402.1 Retrovirus-related Pol polyprotein from transposon [Zancudomyces culisetae]
MCRSVLAHPDWQKSFIVTTDASKHGLGAMLSQIYEAGEKPIEYISRATNVHEHNYSIAHLEGLAVVWAVTKFKYYIWGRVARWAMILRNYDYDIEHIAGNTNPADSFSRMVEKSSENIDTTLEVFSLDVTWLTL